MISQESRKERKIGLKKERGSEKREMKNAKQAEGKKPTYVCTFCYSLEKAYQGMLD